MPHRQAGEAQAVALADARLIVNEGLRASAIEAQRDLVRAQGWTSSAAVRASRCDAGRSSSVATSSIGCVTRSR
jgi:hypothetical protein